MAHAKKGKGRRKGKANKAFIAEHEEVTRSKKGRGKTKGKATEEENDDPNF